MAAFPAAHKIVDADYSERSRIDYVYIIHIRRQECIQPCILQFSI